MDELLKLQHRREGRRGRRVGRRRKRKVVWRGGREEKELVLKLLELQESVEERVRENNKFYPNSVPHCTTLHTIHSNILYYTAQCTALYHKAPHCTTFPYTDLYHTVPHCTTLTHI